MERPWTIRYFTYDHLPEGPLRECSSKFAAVADDLFYQSNDALENYQDIFEWIQANIPDNKERAVAIKKLKQAYSYWVVCKYNRGCRKLLEAKDCAVRALLPVSQL